MGGKDENFVLNGYESSNGKSEVINLNDANLRKMGYATPMEWLEASASHVYIGREARKQGLMSSAWGNQAPVKIHGREKSLSIFRDEVLYGINAKGEENTLWESLEDLEGKQMGCWCSPKYCHGHLLLELLELKKTLDKMGIDRRDLFPMEAAKKKRRN